MRAARWRSSKSVQFIPSQLQYASDGRAEPGPLIGPEFQLFPAGFGQAVEASAALEFETCFCPMSTDRAKGHR